MPSNHPQQSSMTKRPMVVLVVGLLVGVFSWFLVASTPTRPNLSGLLRGPSGRSWRPNANRVHQAVVAWPKSSLDDETAKKAAADISHIPGVEARSLSCKQAVCVLVFVDSTKAPPQTVDRIRRKAGAATGKRPRICGSLPLLKRIRPRIHKWSKGALLTAAALLLAFLLTGGGLRGMIVLTVSWAIAAGVVAAAWRLLHSSLDLMAVLPGLALTATVALSTKRLVDAAGWSGLDESHRAAAAAFRRERGPQFLIAGVTALALLAMGASRFTGLRWPAIWAATAVITAVLTTLIVGTAILAVWPRSFKHHRQASILSRWVGGVQKRAANWPRAGLWVGALMVTGLAVIGFRAKIAIPLRGDGDNLLQPCLFNLDLVVTRGGSDHRDAIDRTLVSKLLQHVQVLPEVEAVFPVAGDLRFIASSPVLSKWYQPASEDSIHLSVMIGARDTAEVNAKAARIARSARKQLRGHPELSAHITGSITEGARTATALSRSYIVGIVRLLGMVFMLLVALTWDRRLGLTAALPAAVCLVVLLAVLATLRQPVTLPILGAMALVASWAVMDALSSVLEAARSRRAGASLPRHASSSSLRAALAVGLAILTGAGYCMDAPFAPAAMLAGGGIMLAAIVSAYGVPTLLAFMPGARLQGPLWEPRRSRIKKRKPRSKRRRPGRRRRRRPKS